MSEDSVEIVVQLTVPVAQRLKAGGVDVAGDPEVDAALRRFATALTPMHPQASDPDLASWFLVGGLSAERAEALVQELRSRDAVRSAYVQPRAAPA